MNCLMYFTLTYDVLSSFIGECETGGTINDAESLLGSHGVGHNVA